MSDHARMIAELARARAVFQQRAIVAVIDDTPNATKPAPDGTGKKG